ncbi:alpha/beta fold hydrolase [Actinokineospora bangkokensis]|uniref:AB hydrolase-1 domain-containing protein n=1 Tax=Actinokineospora bangkokensis TaxID=1193682 RepID=A0A1Q9LSK5_9PSEU|nr:alpha/beta fold hydrolase [Actinokineospora bangkokensis]OLR95022.1 hypothetical protein BJP25_08675 [Actinokineospora bangkokensis]
MIHEEILAPYRALLARHGVEQHRVPTSAGETFVISAGPADAPPVVLLHGSGGNSTAWLREVGAWSRGLRVHSVDIPGEPGLSADNRLAMPDHAPWLAEVLTGLGVERVALVGVSMGGWIALDFARRHPDRVRRLVVLNPAGLGTGRTGLLLKAALWSLLGERGRRRAVRSAVGELTADQEEFLLRVVRRFRMRTDPMPGFPPLRLPMPVLALLGARDAMIDQRATAARLRAEVPHADVRLLPGDGHLLADQGETIPRFLEEP